MYAPGTRVGAIVSWNPTRKLVVFLGYGTYVGDVSPSPLGNDPNPKIQLDNGDIVWGCECWWGPEEKIRSELARAQAQGFSIRTVRIAKYRRDGPAA